MGNSFGKLFRITTFGESHGAGVGVVVDGCPPGMPLSVEDVQVELDRRRPGQSDVVTPRAEGDRVELLSGVHEGRTLGTPIAMLVRNADQRPGAYEDLRDKFRPSHADFSYQAKYGFRNPNGGGRASARETIGRVAGGAVASRVLKLGAGVEICAYVESVQDVVAEELTEFPSRERVEASVVRCPDAVASARMVARIREVRDGGDSVGGVVRCRIRGLRAGLGAPVFDRLGADLGKAVLSLPAAKGFEIGSGFAGTLLRGSAHNDAFVMREGRVRTASNRSGGVQGGISNGEEIFFRVAFKPVATIALPQQTVDVHGNAVVVTARGRHDPCVVPRVVPVVEAVSAVVLLDHWLRDWGQNHAFDF